MNKFNKKTVNYYDIMIIIKLHLYIISHENTTCTIYIECCLAQ